MQDHKLLSLNILQILCCEYFFPLIIDIRKTNTIKIEKKKKSKPEDDKFYSNPQLCLPLGLFLIIVIDSKITHEQFEVPHLLEEFSIKNLYLI